MIANLTGELRRREATVLYALRFLADDEGKVAVRHRDLATALGWRHHTGIRNTTRDLERRGLIRIHPNGVAANTFEVTALGHEVAEAEQERSAA